MRRPAEAADDSVDVRRLRQERAGFPWGDPKGLNAVYSMLLSAVLCGDPAMIGIVRELHKDVRDLTFNYEGRLAGKIYEAYLPEYSARFAFHSDSLVYFDRVVHKGPLPERREMSWSPGQVARVIARNADDSVPVQIVDIVGWSEVWSSQNAAGLFSPAVFAMMNNIERQRLEHVGGEVVDGVNCECFKVEFVPGKGPIPTRHLVWKFWLDLQRGASMLKFEEYNSSELHKRAHSFAIQEFPGKDGRKVWLPVRATMDDFVDYRARGKGWKVGSRPLSSWTFALLPETVALNRGAALEDLAVKFNSMRKVLNFAASEMSNQGPPAERSTRFGVEKEKLEALMARADQQVDELGGRAAKSSDYGESWTAWWPAAVLGLASLAAVGVYLRSRRS